MLIALANGGCAGILKNQPSPSRSPLEITMISLPNGKIQTIFQASLAATGGISPYSWSIASGQLSSGLSLNSAAGTISGVPTQAGTSSFTVQVKDSSTSPQTAVQNLAITVSSTSAALQISTTSLPNDQVQSPYQAILAATGGTTPYRWSIASGQLSSGLSLNSAAGTISGVPTQAGTSSFTVQVKDSSTSAQTAMQTLAVTVSLSPSPAGLQISTTSLPNGQVRSPYQATLTALGGTQPYTWTASAGTLPAGLKLDSSTGTLSGTPSPVGTFDLTAQVTDAARNIATQSLSLVITGPEPSSLKIATSALRAGLVGQSYLQSLSAVAGTGGYSWSLTSGQLPAGMSFLASSAQISGTPTAAGQPTLTFQVSDSSSPPAVTTKSFVLTVYNVGAMDQYGGLTSKPSPNGGTGYFRIEKFDNRWLFVTPAGNAFYMLSVYVVEPSQSIDDLGGSYQNRVIKKYGDADFTWGPQMNRRLLSWGFNSLEMGASRYTLPGTTGGPNWPNQEQPVKLPFVGMIWPSHYSLYNLRNYAAGPVKDMYYAMPSFYSGWAKPYPDVYDNNYSAWIDGEMKSDPAVLAVTAPNSLPWMIGMVCDDTDNENGYAPDPAATGADKAKSVHLGWITAATSPVQTANSAPGGTPGQVYTDTKVYNKLALRDWLTAKYTTIATLNAAWGSNYTTWNSTASVFTAESLGVGNGTTLTFPLILSHALVTPFTVQVKVAGVPVAGDTGKGGLYGPTLSSGSLDYVSGALTVTFAAGEGPAPGAPITVDYQVGGWGTGTGFLDENGSHSWIGLDWLSLSTANPQAKADLDQWIFQIASQQIGSCGAIIRKYLPHTLYLGPTVVGGHAGVARPQVLQATAQNADVVATTWDGNQQYLDLTEQSTGDKPLLTWDGASANPDSALWRYLGPNPTLSPTTQSARGQLYSNWLLGQFNAAYTSTGTHPFIGFRWWQLIDNYGEKTNWGLLSFMDNPYDGTQSIAGGTPGVVGSAPCRDPWGYPCGAEEKNYGNFIDAVTQANFSVFQGIIR
jgi:hypothetical protein